MQNKSVLKVSKRFEQLHSFYKVMSSTLGPCSWWPSETAFEVMVGAILTQNTNWSNVEKAINCLKVASVLEPGKMAELNEQELAELIKPSGFFRLKTKRLKNFLVWLKAICDYDIEKLKNHELDFLRQELLSINGIGFETADSILLYALNKPSFVVDAYTKRIFSRHGLISEDIDYEELRQFFMEVLPEDINIFSEYHALLVLVAKKWCLKSKVSCQSCPLFPFLEYPVYL